MLHSKSAQVKTKNGKVHTNSWQERTKLLHCKRPEAKITAKLNKETLRAKST